MLEHHRLNRRNPVGLAHTIAIAFILAIAIIGALVSMTRETAGQSGRRSAAGGSQTFVSTLVPVFPSESGEAGALATPTIAGRSRRSPIT